uniref:guanylate cyclase n=1 Tax=Macrostomum lignano TaxID=282301 RepID=A0A1I8GB62_9PLAT
MVLVRYGEDMWERILKMAEVEELSFDPHEVYTEGTITRLAESASKVVNIPLDELMNENGRYFMNFLSQYNYDAVLKVLGRDLRDFLNGLDNLHEYLRFTYPKLKPPSFFCVNESRTGITLQYRSRRVGFISYVQGMITEIAKVYFNTKMTVEMVNETNEESVWNYVMRLHFDNKSYEARDDHMPVPSEVFFEVFPFNIVFNRGLKVVKCGRATQQAVPGIQGSLMHEVFVLVRPLIEFTWDAVMLHTNNVFEIAVVEKKDGKKKREVSRKRMSSMTANAVKFRGQMKYMDQWDAIVFLGTPIMRDVSVMANLGLYINDLSMHDSSRDLVLAGDQQSAELKEALEAVLNLSSKLFQEEAKSRQLEESMCKLDEEMKRTDELLYQMIPKGVAERLRSGTSAIDTCETFDDVTVLFSDVVGFTNISSRLQPLQVVDMLNGMYSVFDELTEKHKVYKVETIGDAYMIVSGCPTVTKFHAAFVAEMGLDMVKNIVKCVDPTGQTPHLRIRVGRYFMRPLFDKMNLYGFEDFIGQLFS